MHRTPPTGCNTVDSESTNPTQKRKLAETSPESIETDGNVGNMSISGLMSLMTSKMSAILDEKLKALPTKEDLLEVNESIGQVKTEMGRLSKENEFLKSEIKKLTDERLDDKKIMEWLENGVTNRRIIIKGLKSQRSVYEAARKFFRDIMKIDTVLEIEEVRKLNDISGQMTILVEMRSRSMVSEVLKYTKNLAGTPYYIERDLNKERQMKKKIMLSLKKDILTTNKTKRIRVVGDKLIIEGNQFIWNKDNILMCGRNSGAEILNNIYGDFSANINFDFLKTRIISKN